MDTKLIKDPVHGYIRISKEYVRNILDTSEFQRLRNIRQTSYDSLYPGSSHNRFIHSLGVYHLGCKAYEALKRNIEKQHLSDTKLQWNQLKDTFELACLLHDAGHTPFSHSGEDFLLTKKESDTFQIMKVIRGQKKKSRRIEKLYNDLLKLMQRELEEEKFQEFCLDFAETISGSANYDGKKSVAKPHEIMSVIVAVDTYSEFLKKKDVDINLFARSILGIKYKKDKLFKSAVCNALIQLLNSSIIDVDRLDYIMRDTQMSGFDSTSIDIERLLESVTIVRDKNGIYYFAYNKNALSTIANVVLAHDAERRWIQGHPIVMYDSFKP